MDHADVRAWLDEAFFEPGTLARLDDANADPDSYLAVIRAHMAGCDECSAYGDSLRQTALTLDLAMGPPAAARERVLETVRSVGRERVPAPQLAHDRQGLQRVTIPWWRRLATPRAAAALLVVALIAAGVGAVWGLSVERDTAQDERLISAVNVMTQLVAEPQARLVTLVDSQGQTAGLAVLSTATGRIAIFSKELEPAGATGHSCYLERDGRITEFGHMRDADGVSFWAGPIAAVPDMGLPGDRLLIAMDEEEPPTLVANF